MASARAYIGLGSNLDQPDQQIASAARALQNLPHSIWVALSPLYRSLPWGDPDQADFINAVAAIDTDLSPQQLLQHLLEIELEQGRDRSSGRRNGPRTLDLDLLLHGCAAINQSGLQLPHPRLQERAFVLMPLADLAPDLDVPGFGPLRSLLRPEFASLCWRLSPDDASI